MKRAAKLSIPLLGLLFATSLVLAQNPLGRIVGTVVDQTGAVVPGSTVMIVNEGTGQQQTQTSSSEGAFFFSQLQPGFYTVKIEAKGFKTRTYTEAKVDPGQDYSLAVVMDVGDTSETVTVQAGADIVNTSSPEVSNTVAKRQIIDLPLNGRNPIELIRLQAGVPGITNRTTTAINGGRPSWTQVTQDGINIQDNFIRTNSLDFVPNRPTADTIGEFTITTTNQGADSAGGSSQVKLITPSGGNELHGTLYEFNRNSVLSANSWFNNAARPTVARPFLNRNQFGGNVSGPILKNKLFFFGSYEGFRQSTATTQNNTIPVNNDFLTGVFKYIRPTDNTVQSVNVLSLVGLSVDQKIKSVIIDQTPNSSRVNNFDVGNSTSSRQLNTAGYRFNQQDLNNRNQFQGRVDYNMTKNHKFEGSFQWFKETDDRTDLDAINARPKVFTESTVKFFAGAWRWSTARFQNELRIGANLAPVAFNTDVDYGGALLSVPFITSRQVTFLPQGRDTRTRHFIDNASLTSGDHSMQFGGSLQQIRVRPYNFAGQFPTVSFGFSAAAPTSVQLNANLFPQDPNNTTGQRIQPTDLANANALASFLAGVISQVSQTFQVRNQTSGFVPGLPEEKNLSLNNWAFYFQDNWRLRSNLTLRYGLKWEYFSPVKEDNNLGLVPELKGRDVRQVLLDPNGVVNFVNGGIYGRDLNNFGPTAGFAWDPFKDGKTSVRGGYTMSFVNEEAMTVVRNAFLNNSGLTTSATLVNQYTRFAQGIPQPAVTFKVPRTYADQLALAPTSVASHVEPNLRQPYIHQITFGISRELGGWLRDFAIEGRYVGTLGRDIWRGIDINQTNAGINKAFLDDFRIARNNGFLALAASGAFNPNYNATIAGSQQLNLLPNIGAAGATAALLNNTTVRALIQQGQPAGLADFYVTSRVAGSNALFLPNPGIYASNLIINGGTSDYHSFQFEARRRLRNGIFGQMNYTFSKALANSAGTSQARLEPFLDNARPELEKTRADFDVTHIINSNIIYELPFGKGQRFLSGAGRWLDGAIGGWQLSLILRWQSGSPFSILSQRATFNRSGRAAGNPASSNLSRDQIKDLFGIRKLPNGQVFYISPGVIDTATGRAVGADNLNNTAAFGSQVFFNPLNEQIGTLQRLQFDGPSVWGNDLSIFKRFAVTERIRFELRGDLFNFMNSPIFFFGDQSVNSAQFGRITSLIPNVGSRVVQVSGRINF